MGESSVIMIEHSKATIVVIDDVPDNLRILTELLSEQGYEVVAFSEGAFALESICSKCVRPEKDRELLLTLHELESLKRQASGYVGAAIHRHPGGEQVITLHEQWQTRKDCERYMQSYAFEILCGAITVLTSSAEIEIMSENRFSNHDTLYPFKHVENVPIRKNAP